MDHLKSQLFTGSNEAPLTRIFTYDLLKHLTVPRLVANHKVDITHSFTVHRFVYGCSVELYFPNVFNA